MTPSCLAIALLCCACGSTPAAPVPNQAPGSTVPPPDPSPPVTPGSVRYRVSGVVTDENGSPLADAHVEVEYNSPAGGVFSNPPSFCFSIGCWFKVKTDAGGRYDVVFDAAPSTRIGQIGSAGDIAVRGGGWHNYQILPWGRFEIVQNLKLKRLRTIGVGGGTTVTIDSDSSLCTDREDLFALGYRCEAVEVSVGAAGTLIVDARAETGGVVPTMFWATTGNYTGPPARSGPGTLSIPVRSGSFLIMVGTPVGSGAQQFTVQTSLR